MEPHGTTWNYVWDDARALGQGARVLLPPPGAWYERGVKRLASSLRFAATLSCGAGALVGCGGSDPELGNFHIPSQVTVDDEVEATVSVFDEDGLGEMLFTVRMADGTVTHEVHHAIEASEDVTMGDLELYLGFFLAGTYQVSVWVTDQDGNESNRLSATVAVAPEPGS